MRFYLSAVVKDLNRMRKDPGGLILSGAIPLVIAFLLRLAFGGGGTGAQITAELLIVDHDNSVVSGLMRGALNQGPPAQLISTDVLEGEEEARARLDKGDASALLLIPSGFGDAVIQNRPVALTLITNPAQRILPGIIRETLGMFTEAAFYAQNLMGEPIRDIAAAAGGGGASDQDVAGVASRVNQAVTAIAPYALPPVIDLAVSETPGDDTPGPDFGALFLPGMLFMALMFVAQGQSDDLWKERDAGTLRRTLTTPARLAGFLAGKVTASVGFMFLVGLVGLLAGQFVFGVHISNLIGGAAWMGLSGIVLLLMMMLVQLFTTSARGGHVMTTVVLFPLVMAGGSFFPLEVMPDFLASIGRLTPNGWSLQVLKHIIGVTPGDTSILAAAGLVVATSVVLFSLCLLRLRRGFAAS